MFRFNDRVEGVTGDLINLYKNIDPSTIGHMTDFGFLKGLKPLFQPIRFVGNAVTVRIPHMDSTAVHKVLDFVEQGDVIVIDMSGDVDRSCWGEMLSFTARVKKVAGVIVAGSINDIQEIKEIGIPLFSLGVSPLTTRILGIEGEINTPISVCGVSIHPGDLILANDDGVFAVRPDIAKEYAQIALNEQDEEIDMKAQIESGVSLASFEADHLLNNN